MIGPGLLGGSILKAVRQFQPECELRIWARRVEVLEVIRGDGLADVATDDLADAVEGADLIVLAMPIQFMEGVVARFPELKKGCVVTDVGSTKASVVATLEGTVEGLGALFVGSHPMAGSEKTGIEHASADLFVGAPVIVTADSGCDSARRVAAFWETVGGRVSFMNPEEHDSVVASISHLPHLLASALVLSTLRANPAQANYSGGGFRDTTRIASGDPEMWTGIMLDNQAALLSSLDDMIQELANWREALAALDKDEVHRFLSAAKECRDKINQRG
ncbi:MAG: prephenate dehydrogenase/arogenate dehydrogenase family protein [Verrucomicrobiales bacterium]|nr:prephenate dehydrogenase/arogenate dehydrogenase family protein [Verrucomicrobiales bacterium]